MTLHDKYLSAWPPMFRSKVASMLVAGLLLRSGAECCAAQALSIHPLGRTVFANGVYYPSLVLNVMEYFIFMKYAK